MSTATLAQPPAAVAQAIPGNPDDVRSLARTFSALAGAAGDAATSVHNHRKQLATHWQAQSAQLAQVVLTDTATTIGHGHRGLADASTVLHRYANELATAQQQYTAAAAQVTQLQAQVAANPSDAHLACQLDRAVTRLQTPVTDAQHAAHRAARQLDAIVPPALAVRAHGHLDADTALFIDTEVGGHRVSRAHGVRAGNRIASMSGKDRGKLYTVFNSAGSKGRDQALNMLGSGKSVAAIDNKLGQGQYFSLSGPGEKLNGKVSWFGGPHDSQDSGTTASGIPESVPGIAVYNQSTLRGYWLVEFPNGKKLVLQQTDIGPAPWTGRKVDVTYSALPKAGYSEGNFPTDSTVHARFLGMHVPPGVATT